MPGLALVSGCNYNFSGAIISHQAHQLILRVRFTQVMVNAKRHGVLTVLFSDP